jgi:C6 transcription factor Pro1
MEVAHSTVHVPPIRSNRGCWTCRLRKKKCDEVVPGCLRCASVDVECHYGPKPKWIGNPILGKKELERIKSIVGASASRKRAALRAKSQSISKSPKDRVDVSRLDRCSPTISGYTPSLAVSISSPSHDTINQVDFSQALPGQPKWVEGHEASLIMHYLDHVFFVQFRFHTPSISAGGRGWLLSLLTQTKPLYHAALSLSACLAQEGGEVETDYLKELERHHNLAIKELQLFIKAHSERASLRPAFGGNIQILACMVQLISFEVWVFLSCIRVKN